MFSILIGSEDHGPFASEAEVTAVLGEYRANHPEDPDLSRVAVQEMPEHGTVGHERSVWDFVEVEHEEGE